MELFALYTSTAASGPPLSPRLAAMNGTGSSEPSPYENVVVS